jgi:putative transposase
MSFVLTNYVKNEFPFLKEVDKFALEGSLRNLDYAYNGFFENVIMRKKPYGFPKFKSKRKSKKSYTTKFTNNNIQLNLEEKKIKLPNFFHIALTVHNYLGQRTYILLMGILSNVF